MSCSDCHAWNVRFVNSEKCRDCLPKTNRKDLWYIIFFWKILIEEPVILLAKYSKEGYEEIYLNLKKSTLLCIFYGDVICTTIYFCEVKPQSKWFYTIYLKFKYGYFFPIFRVSRSHFSLQNRFWLNRVWQ